ncbi:MAG: DNA-3-methyladenine glycosylase, partial [Polyangiaceae bacterium]
MGSAFCYHLRVMSARVESLAAPLPRSFFARDARVVARALIGTRLVVETNGCVRVGRIVETEAYRGPKDAACHARVGLTSRTRVLFGPPAHAYVFLIYGMYDCFNVVAHRDGGGHAVLVRAVEPISGITEKTRTDGPGRLTRALGITRAHHGLDVTASNVRILPRAENEKRPRIAVSARVGVGYAGEIAEAPWRFY